MPIAGPALPMPQGDVGIDRAVNSPPPHSITMVRCSTGSALAFMSVWRPSQ